MIGQTSTNICQSCSSSQYPLQKNTPLVVACVLQVILLCLLASSARLYWLRKHSGNVFVRCSAIWRFVLLTSCYYFVTLAPFVTSTLLDYFTDSTFFNFYEKNSNILTPGNVKVFSAEFSVFNLLSPCFVLVHCAFLPLLYLIRLLGFRRILSSL